MTTTVGHLLQSHFFLLCTIFISRLMSWPVSRRQTHTRIMTIFNSARCLDEIDEALILSVFSQPCSIIYLGTFSSLHILSICLSFIPNTICVPEFCSTFALILWQWFVCVCLCVCACCALDRDCVWLPGSKEMKTTSSAVLNGNQDSGAHAARDGLMSFYLVAQ